MYNIFPLNVFGVERFSNVATATAAAAAADLLETHDYDIE
jgi:hypothetical protein